MFSFLWFLAVNYIYNTNAKRQRERVRATFLNVLRYHIIHICGVCTVVTVSNNILGHPKLTILLTKNYIKFTNGLKVYVYF